MDIKNFFIIPQRWLLGIMAFLGIVNAYAMRICLNVAITQMVKKHESHGTIDQGYCPRDNETVLKAKNSNGANGEFEWDEELQGLILSSFYWGYLITHLPGGILSEKFGGKWTLSLGILSTAIFTLLTPLAVYSGGPHALVALRALEGLGEGTTFPALSILLASWTPLSDRSTLGSFVFGGGQFGTIFGTYTTGYLLSIYDWPVVFYFFGSIGILWFILFTFLCYSDPKSHPFIKDSEKAYLLESMGQLERDKNLPPTPWLKIITSAPMLALICAQIGHDWSFYIMVTDLPKYMNDVLHFNIKENGLYSALPSLVMWIVSNTTGVLGDWLIKKGYIGITNSRKFFTTLASTPPAIFLMLASYAGCDKLLVVIYFTLSMGIMGCYYPGMKVNPLDLSPNYSGTLMAITNGIGSIAGILAPYLVGVMTPNRSLPEWRAVFWIAFVIFVISNVVYVIWASGEVQPFNEPNKKSTEDHEAAKNTKPDTKDTNDTNM